jgi:hypothetical protein
MKGREFVFDYSTGLGASLVPGILRHALPVAVRVVLSVDRFQCVAEFLAETGVS